MLGEPPRQLRRDAKGFRVADAVLLSDHRSGGAPSTQLDHASPLSVLDGTKLPGKEATEPLIVSRHQQLSLVLGPPKEIDKAQQVDVVEALERVIQDHGLHRTCPYA